MRQITCYMEFRLIIVSHAVKWFSELINSSIIWHNGTNWECETSFNACTYICANILFWSNESSKTENKKLNCMIQILESTASSNKPCWLWYVVIKYAEKIKLCNIFVVFASWIKSNCENIYCTFDFKIKCIMYNTSFTSFIFCTEYYTLT